MKEGKSHANLGSRRAEKSRNNADWSPKECAEQFLADIKSGDIKPDRLYLMYWEESDNADLEDADEKGFWPGSYTCNLSYQEELAMLEIEKASLMDRWRNKE